MTYLRGVVEASKLTIGNKAPTVSELLGDYLGRNARDNGFISEEINFIWTSFDDPKATYKAGIDTCVSSVSKDSLPFVFNIHACEEDNDGAKNKVIQVSLWNRNNTAIKEPSFKQLAEYKVALYNHTTGKISAQKSFGRTEQRSSLEAIINQSDCNQEVDARLKKAINENYVVSADLQYRYSVLFFDREGNLIVPDKN